MVESLQCYEMRFLCSYFYSILRFQLHYIKQVALTHRNISNVVSCQKRCANEWQIHKMYGPVALKLSLSDLYLNNNYTICIWIIWLIKFWMSLCRSKVKKDNLCGNYEPTLESCMHFQTLPTTEAFSARYQQYLEKKVSGQFILNLVEADFTMRTFPWSCLPLEQLSLFMRFSLILMKSLQK